MCIVLLALTQFAVAAEEIDSQDQKNCDPNVGLVDGSCLISQDRTDPCEAPQSTLEINDCLQKKLNKTEAELESVYRKVIHEVSQPDQFGFVHYAEAKRNLLQSQRAWKTYRKKDCSAVYALAVGASMRGELHLGCMQARTEQRIRELRDILGQ